MAMEGSSAAVGGRSASAGATADSYIGSVISLTSKSEIRYEGILYNINTDESSIGLQNVRSFGTEGRKKDGPQVPPSDKIYEYILFRGSDIKDLQVKSSPTIQSTPPINSDPAIIQSHYPHPTGQPSSLPTASGGSLADHSSNTSLQGSNFQVGLPSYQPGGNLNSWAPSPPNANAGGLPMPMYWQGFYGAPGGLPQLPQQSMLVPPPGLPIPSAVQQMQLSGFRSSLPLSMSSLPSSSLPDHSLAAPAPSIPSSSSLTSNLLPPPTLPLSNPPLQTGLFAPATSSSFPLNKVPVSANAELMPIPNLSHFSKLPSSVPDISGAPLVSIKTIPGPPVFGTQNVPSQQTAISAFSLNNGSVVSDTPTPPLVTPGQLLQPAPGASNQILQTAQKDVEVVQVSSSRSSEPLVRVETEAQPPILPSLMNTRTQKSNGSPQNTQNNNRVRGGRAHTTARPVTKFTEDFDFTAMNEKFNKDEVWGNLGKGIKTLSKDKEVYESGNAEEEVQAENDLELPKVEIRPSYKDDFFDTLSCNRLDSDPNHGRTRYSEQMKLDTETFGEFSRYRGGRGVRGPYRGGRGGHGPYRGRGYGGGGRSHGYMVRGRGRGAQDRFS